MGRKVAAFCALLTLGWTYFRLLVLGDSLRQIYPEAPDPSLRQALWVALLLIMAQGWDIPTDRIAAHWRRLQTRLPALQRAPAGRPATPSAIMSVIVALEPIVIALGRFMDLCVAVANKVGAFAVLAYLVYLAGRFAAGASLRPMYPNASDPMVSFLADLCVYVVVLGWWATPIEQILAFWARLRGHGVTGRARASETERLARGE